MDNKKFEFWRRWLTWANIITIIVGFLVAFAGNSIIFEMHNDYTKEVFFDGEEFQDMILNFKNWLFGIIGGTIIGFHILMIFISENAFRNKEKWAYKALWVGLLSWFLVDSSISIYYGAIFNLILINMVALLLIGLPLVMTRKEFKN